jgi:hypothetical protein
MEAIMEDLPRVRTICAICKKVIKEGLEKKNPSHGHCDSCNTKWLWLGGLPEKDLTEFIEERGVQHAKKI